MSHPFDIAVDSAAFHRLGGLTIFRCTDPDQLTRARDVLKTAGYGAITRNRHVIVRDRNPETSP